MYLDVGLAAMTLRDIESQRYRAHELYGDFWFNSEPLPISALRGQVILLEVWDYTCTSSLRTLPYIKEWDQKYHEHGLVVVGVHTPKFPFAKDPEAVQKAIASLGIRFPVVMDNEHLIAAHYDQRVWPTMYLVDKNGFVRFQSDGEGNYDVIERAIQTLLHDARVGEQLPLLMQPIREEDRQGAALYRPMPEIFAGYLRGSIGNIEGYSPESVVEYTDPEVYLPGRFYVDGRWLNQRDCLSFFRQADNQGHVIVKYQALEVNAVLRSEKEPCKLIVSQDGQPLDQENRGLDVSLEPRGQSQLNVQEARLYSIIRNREYGEHTLKMAAGTDGLALYSFAFVTSLIPELVSNN